MENILWKEELEGKHVCVVLSGDNRIVDAGEVKKYPTGGEEERGWEKGGLDHAMAFDTRERRRLVLDVVRRFDSLAE